ncbi:hypothetical protein OUZ56_013271 [Daphnia magna]|uniref:Uncharacterized protein n=1 Tax=Daphnia magna TaxID=35525 RepID=A0ABQ9Z5E3_9CRUS|nr:hypothetical protein OUZ56_013271 [Daphnia magna]
MRTRTGETADFHLRTGPKFLTAVRSFSTGSYCNSKVRDKPKVVRSLRRCAPLWPIAELKIVLCLTITICHDHECDPA